MSFSKYTAEEVFVDSKTDIRNSRFLMDIGGTYTLNDYFSFFGALGFASTTSYQGYYDKFGILGRSGSYYLKDSDTSGANIELGLTVIPNPDNSLAHLYLSYSSFFQVTSVGIDLPPLTGGVISSSIC